MLNRFKWYRKLRGGTWIKWFDKILYGGHESWKRYKGSGDAMLDLPEMIKYRCKPMFVENYNSYEIGTDFMLLSMILQANGTGYGHLSDGYHTFDELYEHRNVLFCKYISSMKSSRDVWKSKVDSKGSFHKDWFAAGISDIITYHLPIELWDLCDVPVVDKGKDNGHTSSDVLWNLKHIQYLALDKTVENHQGWKPKPHKLESNVPVVHTIPLPMKTRFQVEPENDGPIFQIISDEADYDGSYEVELVKTGLSWQELGSKTRWSPHDKEGHLFFSVTILDQ